MAKKYRQQQRPQGRKHTPATSSDWDRLREDPALRDAWVQFAKAVSFSQYVADERSRTYGVTVTPDLREAGRLLDQHPQLVKYLDAIKEREAARLDAVARPDLTLASPTGGMRGDPMMSGLGSWAGSGYNKNNPIGVHNARQLRDWADSDPWIDAGLNFLSERVARSDVAVLPEDERKPYNRKVLKDMQLLLDQPNELRDTWPMLVGMFVRDLLTLGQGVFTKNMTPVRLPVAFYCEDAATIKIYPAWSGDPDEPRYLYQEGTIGNFNRQVPLRNDEAIVVFYHPTSYRFGQGAIQTLADTIQADLAATKAAMHLVDFKPPPHAIQIEGASDTQIKALRTAYETEIQGRREVMFLGGNGPAHVFPLIFSARDNQWLEWQEYLLRKMCAVLQIVPQDLGMTYQVNKATSLSQQDISESKGFLPIQLLLEQHWNREFLADYAPKLPMGRRNLHALNLRVVFPEISEAARMLHAEKTIDLATKGLAGLPSFTLNQLLMGRGEEPVDGGNTFWVMTNNGPMPWLSYDREYGDYTSSTTTAGDLGSQDAGGGIAADDSADDDMGDPGTGANDTSQTAATEATATESGAETSGSAGDATKRYSGLSEWQFRQKAKDDEEEVHTGVMVAFILDVQDAERLTIPDGEPASDLHVTLAFLGDTRDLPVEVSALQKMLAGFAAEAIPLQGKIAGIGRFTPSESSDGLAPVIALVDIPGLPAWRERLVKHLAAHGCPADGTHGFTPHITLAYIDADAPMPVEDVPPLDLSFDTLWLAVGQARTAFPLGGEQYPQKRLSAAPAHQHHHKAQETLTGARDIRKPGTSWNPTTSLLQRGAQSRKRVPSHLVESFHRPQAEEQARMEVAAAVKRVFEDAAKRGSEKAG